MDIATERWSERTIDAKTAVRCFDVPSSIAADEEAARVLVAGTFGCSIGAAHPWTPNLRVTSDGPKAVQAGFTVYRVTVNYAIGNFTDPRPPGPLLVEWNFGGESIETDVDVENNTILNTAGDVFGQFLTRTDSLIGFTLYQDILPASYDAGQAVQYANAFNSDTIGLFGYGTVAPGQCRCISIAPAGQYAPSAAATYIKKVYKFDLKRGIIQDSDGIWDAFRTRMLSTGNNGWYMKSGTPMLGQFYRGASPATNVLLDENGLPIDDTVTVLKTNETAINNPDPLPAKLLEVTTKATFLKFRKCTPMPFLALGVF